MTLLNSRHQPLLHAIRNMFVSVLVLPPIEMICKMCCPTSDIHSTVVLEYAMWSSARENIPSDAVAGRVRGMVVSQGSYKQKTLSVTRNMVGVVVGEGGRSTGVLLYTPCTTTLWLHHHQRYSYRINAMHCHNNYY